MELTAISLTDDPWKVEVAEPKRDWMDRVPEGHIYRCLPMVAACGMGWVIRSPCDFTVVWNGQWGRVPDLLFDWGPWTPESLRASKQIGSHFGSGIITFRVPFLFRTSEPGIGLRVSGAPNFYRFNCTALEGWVETWWLPFPFTMNWKVDAPYVPVQFKTGDPLVFIQPYRISDLEATEPKYGKLEDQPKAFKEAHREWTRSRNAFNQAIVQGQEKGWQKHYAKGIDHGGGHAAEHRRSVLSLASFEEGQGTLRAVNMDLHQAPEVERPERGGEGPGSARSEVPRVPKSPGSAEYRVPKGTDERPSPNPI